MSALGVDEACALCCGSNWRGYPLLRTALRPVRHVGGADLAPSNSDSAVGEVRRCHLQCVRNLLSEAATGPAGSGLEVVPSLAVELRQLLAQCPSLDGQNACVRIAQEEIRLSLAASTWPPSEPPPPPAVAFLLEGIEELRISSCASLFTLPSSVGGLYGLKSLVLISDGIQELPSEVGAILSLERLYLNGNFIRCLPPSVGQLPRLKELCLDSNLLEEIPPLASKQLALLAAPGNRLIALPSMDGRLDRLELHGNALVSLSLSGARWDRMTILKLMGNGLRRLPEELEQMQNLRVMNAACNRLDSLPACLAKMWRLEWLFVYLNDISDLPVGLLLGGSWLDRLLLEGNPLCGEAVLALVAEARQSKARTVGLDVSQVRSAALAFAAAQSDAMRSGTGAACRADSDLVAAQIRIAGSSEWEPLPPSVSVGSLVDVSDLRSSSCQRLYLKLSRASHLRRAPGIPAYGEFAQQDAELAHITATGQPCPADLLVVAFAASLGEPEWLGALRQLAASGHAAAQPPPVGPLTEAIGPPSVLGRDDRSIAHARLAALWANCVTGERETTTEEVSGLRDVDMTPVIGEGVSTPATSSCSQVPLADFDVLSVVDHRMRWYSEDRQAYSEALGKVAQRYSRVIFVGASMGGFGALLHGAELADAVLAFSPQARLDHAILRPPAMDTQALQALVGQVTDSVRQARSRGATVEVHCAADEHFWHALALPLDDLALCVHPLLPRKPFARLLDRAGLLQRVLSDSFFRLLQGRLPQRHRHQVSQMPPQQEEKQTKHHQTESTAAGHEETEIAVARWGRQGCFTRHVSKRAELLQLFFGPHAPSMPRPGDWFCSRCGSRSTAHEFFCHWAGNGCDKDSSVLDCVAAKVPAGGSYPQPGDWGCGACRTANCSYNRECTGCWVKREAHQGTVVCA